MIEINNLTAREIDENFLKELAKKVIFQEKGEADWSISLVLVGSSRMRGLNYNYRGKNRVTDVLSFAPRPEAVLSEKILGEIVICLREVGKNAKRKKTSFPQELGLVLIHGLLHLLGYDHEAGKAEAGKMAAKEKQYFKKMLE